MVPRQPKNLNLFTIHFPLPAIISILHRISGLVLFLLIPILLYGLKYSLTYSGFAELQEWIKLAYIKFFLWLLLVPFVFHLIAGIRHLLSDIHIGNSFYGGKRSALLVLITAVLLILVLGIYLW